MDERSTVSDLAERLAQDGFVLLDQLFSSEYVQQFSDVSRRTAHEVQEALGTKDIGIGSSAGYDEIVQRSPGRWDVPISPLQFGIDENDALWSPLVSAVLGKDAEHSFSGVVFSDPGSPAQCWHIDSPHLAAVHQQPHALNVLVALHNIPMKMGPTEFARGSHFLTNHLYNPSLVPDEMIYQHTGTSPAQLVRDTLSPVPEGSASELSAGSCLVFDDRLLHRGLANHSSVTRRVAYFSYRRKGYSANTHFESQQSVFDARS